MEKEIRIVTSWSNEISPQMKSDFMNVENAVFNGFCTESLFATKYLNNIYGPSVLVVAYLNEIPVGADALWRNDIDGRMAYQSADTCVLDSSRGMGVFTKMVKAKISVIQKDAMIYGFPNVNSFPGFLKMGWIDQKLYKSVTVLGQPRGVGYIDGSYAKWWLQFQTGISYLKRQGAFYLVRKRKGKPMGTVIGRVDEKIAVLFPKCSFLLWLKSFSSQALFYNKDKYISLIYAGNSSVMDVPYWKIDAI